MSLASRAFADVITLTRASAGYYWNADGVLTLADPNVPRFDYHPISGELLGLHIEEARTNLFLNSQDYTTGSWTKKQATITPNATTAPDGTLTAQKLVESTDNLGHYIDQVPSGIDTTTATTRTIFVKAAERSFVSLFTYCAHATGSYARLIFDLTKGVFSSVYAVNGTQTYAATQLLNGWWRITQTVTFTTVDNALICRTMSAIDSSTYNYAGDGVSGIYLWGSQLENAIDASSYIPTTTAQATRASDVVQLKDLSWFNPAAGTFFVEYYRTRPAPLNLYATIFSVDDRTINNRIQMRSNGIGNRPSALVAAGAVTQASGTTSSPDDRGQITRRALAYQAGDLAHATNGVLDLTMSPPVLPNAGVITSCTLGSQAGGTSGFLNGYMRGFKYWPYRRDNATLQTDTVKDPYSTTLSMDFNAEKYSMGIL